MKKLIFMALSLIFLASSCSNDDRKSDEQPTPALITPDISVRMAEPLSVHPFTGILEIYPCNDESSVYYGNYFTGKLTPFYGYYTILNGDISGQYNRELHLPVGNYNMVYWGTPKYDEPIHNSPQIVSPGLLEGADLSKLYFSLRSIGNGLYSPVYDLVHAVKSAHIGTDALQTSLSRVSSGLKMVIKQSDGSAFIPEIASVKVNIGNIAEKINFYTGTAENMANATAAVSSSVTARPPLLYNSAAGRTPPHKQRPPGRQAPGLPRPAHADRYRYLPHRRCRR